MTATETKWLWEIEWEEKGEREDGRTWSVSQIKKIVGDRNGLNVLKELVSQTIGRKWTDEDDGKKNECVDFVLRSMKRIEVVYVL